MIIDVHCHYALSARLASPEIERFSFEPAYEPQRPAYDSYLAPRALNRLSFRMYRRLAGIDAGIPPGPDLDAALESWSEKHLLADGPIDRFVLLAFDEYHTNAGERPLPPTTRFERGGDMYTSNSMIRAHCRARPDRYMFGASIHPYRENAVECVREVAAAGAVLLKWLPLHQNIDIADQRTLAVLRACAEIGLPVLVHYNEEFTLATQHPEHMGLSALLDVLRMLKSEGCMPITIVAHVATPVTPLGIEQPFRDLCRALLGEFRDSPLYADISALTTLGKIKYLRWLARRQDLHSKLLFGSDFPVPVSLFRLRPDLGRAYATIRACPSWPQQVVLICRQLGFNEPVFHKAEQLLARTSSNAGAAAK